MSKMSTDKMIYPDTKPEIATTGQKAVIKRKRKTGLDIYIKTVFNANSAIFRYNVKINMFS